MIGFVFYALSLDTNTHSNTTQLAVLCFCGLRLIPSLQKCAISLMQIGLCSKALDDLCSLFKTSTIPIYRNSSVHKSIQDVILKRQIFELNYAKIKYIIEDDIHISSGIVTFITGESGVGKSLFIRSLIGNYEKILHYVICKTTKKNVKINDFKIGYVSQKSVLFDSTIGSNIVFNNNIDMIKKNIDLIRNYCFKLD